MCLNVAEGLLGSIQKTEIPDLLGKLLMETSGDARIAHMAVRTGDRQLRSLHLVCNSSSESGIEREGRELKCRSARDL